MRSSLDGRARAWLLLWSAVCVVGCEPRNTTSNDEAPSSKKQAKGVPDANGICTLHGVPHELCTKCNPALAQVFKAKGDWCHEHEFPESFCPVCNPNAEIPGYERETTPSEEESVSDRPGQPREGVSDGRPTAGEIEGRVVRFASPEIEDAADIGVVAAVKDATTPEVACAARIAFDADKVADVRALVPGIVRQIDVEVGDSVEAGERLFTLESERIGSVQSDLQNARERVRVARADLERKKRLRDEQITSARAVELAQEKLVAAEAEEKAAAATLRIAGASRGNPSGRYGLNAPITGQVIRRPAVMGALATADISLATIADTSTMWVLCDVPEQSAHLVERGQTLSFSVGDAASSGAIIWLSPEVDPRTRTVTARVEVTNPSGRLRANQFVNATIQTGAPSNSVMVPRDAIQRIEGHEVVFVRARKGLYLPKVITSFGGANGPSVAVRGDVKPGDEIVTKGAVLLRTEAMPGSIGAGCCEVEPAGGE